MSYDIRQSQVINTWPAGSMIDFPQLSLIMLCHDDDDDDWGRDNDQNENNRNTITDSRLAEALKVKSFIVPPSNDGVNNAHTYGIRFPRAHYCPSCGLMTIIKKTDGQKPAPSGKNTVDAEMKPFFCEACLDRQSIKGPHLIAMRFVIATEEGFIDDFPWDWYVHKNKPLERNRGNKLYFRSKGGSASLNDIFIESCRVDGSFVAKRDLSQIFDQRIFAEECPEHGNYLKYVKGYMPKPWKGWHSENAFKSELITVPDRNSIWDGDELTDVAKRKFPRTMQRGAGNIIFPIIYSSILLPPASYQIVCPVEVQEKIQKMIDYKLEEYPDEYQSFKTENWKQHILDALDRNAKHSLLNLGFDLEDVRKFILNYFSEKTQETSVNKAESLRQQEFKAFCSDIAYDENIWFYKKSVDGSDYNDLLRPGLLDEVVLLEKLSALKVYRGFTRVKPLMSDELIFADEKDNLNNYQLNEFQRIQDARKDPVNTKQLPAVEVKGEGIFLRFNNNTLNNWSREYPDKRLNTINTNLKQANHDFNQEHDPINKRYLFLHTLSHILLKELSEDCGYSLSSLSEIIYCSDDAKIGTEDEMNGILIYTTTSDSEGSLGGLVEKGDSKYLSAILTKGIDRARWCSSDPLCISSENGQGFMGLNLAACYSCVLLPETSCEKMNKYLDRATIVGTLSTDKIGLFQI